MGPDDSKPNLVERPNKTQLKRETDALRQLVEQLVALPATTLAKVSLDESLRDAIVSARQMKRAALQRQLQYVVGLMRDTDTDVIVESLRVVTQPQRHAVQAFHEVEQWRDALIAGDEELLNDLVIRLSADRQYLRQLIRNARKEHEQTKPPKSARVLFRYLTGLQSSG